MTTRSYRLNRLALDLELAASARRAELNRIAREQAYTERTAAGIAPVAPAELAGWFANDAARAWAALAEMNAAQLTNTAIEYAVYLEGTGVLVAWGDIIACWERKLAAKFAAAEAALVTPEQVAEACTAQAAEYRETADALEAEGNEEAARDLRSAARACDKAAFYALEGTAVYRWSGERLLVRSASEDRVYAVTAAGCPCPGGTKGRGCWHQALRAGAERAQFDATAQRAPVRMAA